MTALLERPTGRPSDNGARGLPPAPTRTRVPVMLLGLLIVLGSGIGFALWSTDLNSRESVLVAARPIAAGDVIGADAFRVAELGGASDVAAIPMADASLFYGSVAVDDIAEGAVVNRFQFSSSGGLDAGQAIVGVVLEPGESPVPTLRPGDLVEVVATASNTSPARVLATAEVYAVRAASELSTGVTVSLVVDHGEDSTAIADAAAAGRIRLVLLPEA